MWLDRTLEKNSESNRPDHIGELWMVHGGGFYHVEKMQMGPTQVPPLLHWFKWESYWTWLSGAFLLSLIFYAGSGTFLLDSAVSQVSFLQALGMSLSTIVVSWLFYDTLWESNLVKKISWLGHVLTVIWFCGAAYFLCHVLSGRAAYIHIGAMLGTWMTANVFLRIIPRQLKMVEATKKGEPVNQDWSKNAKNRSTHNTYFTLPVIFIMLSNHFPSTYGSKYNWIILLLLSAAGASIREFFVSRIKKPAYSRGFGTLGLVCIVCAIVVARDNSFANSGANSSVEAEKPLSPRQVVVNPVEQGHSSVHGNVHFEGEVPKREKLQLPLSCTGGKSGDVYPNDIVVNGGKLKNVLVRVVKGLEGRSFGAPPADSVILDQKECRYEPRVVGIRVGQKLEIVNSDATFHNVRSVTKNNGDFNIAMPVKDQRITKVFDRPEIVVETKCSVHPWMSASIAVVEHPFFDVTNERGEYGIKNLPSGHYTLEAWHEVFGTLAKEIDVRSGESVSADFTFKTKE